MMKFEKFSFSEEEARIIKRAGCVAVGLAMSIGLIHFANQADDANTRGERIQALEGVVTCAIPADSITATQVVDVRNSSAVDQAIAFTIVLPEASPAEADTAMPMYTAHWSEVLPDAPDGVGQVQLGLTRSLGDKHKRTPTIEMTTDSLDILKPGKYVVQIAASSQIDDPGSEYGYLGGSMVCGGFTFTMTPERKPADLTYYENQYTGQFYLSDGTEPK